MKNKGYVHIYCGDGKGKTTAATGLAVRAAGNGWKVLFYQFMKDNESGERNILGQVPGIILVDGLEEEKFSFQMTPEEKAERRTFYHQRFRELVEQVEHDDIRMLVLDEIIYTIRAGLFEEEKLLTFLDSRPVGLEVVLTGHAPGGKLIEAADYVSEICKRKHPYNQGISARAGIER